MSTGSTTPGPMNTWMWECADCGVIFGSPTMRVLSNEDGVTTQLWEFDRTPEAAQRRHADHVCAPVEQ